MFILRCRVWRHRRPIQSISTPCRVCFVWTAQGAEDVGVPPQRIGDIVAGKRAVTADTDLRLCRYFGLSDGWWLRGQANYDTAIARETMGKALSRIARCELLAG